MKTILLTLAIPLLLTACLQQRHKDEHTAHQHLHESKYTCPMHPQIVRDKPGQCPVCGMELVKVSAHPSNDLMLTDHQIMLGNITTQRVAKRRMGQSLAINGRLAADEQTSEVISSRAEGRVEKLFVKETGKSIQKGQPLYTLYSEQLLTLQREYLLAKNQFASQEKDKIKSRSFVSAAKKKLLLYGLTENQINQLQNENNLLRSVTLTAPASGIVTEIMASEGKYVGEGTSLYRIEDVRKLWVEAELYPEETSLLKVGDKISVQHEGAAEMTDATVVFVSPEYKANTQVTLMRASIENPALQMKPGQEVQVYLTDNTKETVAIPVDAVVREENGMQVYIQTARNTFRPVMVKTGRENSDFAEITEGLHEGDTVVVSGVYLVYSAFVLREGQDPMKKHTH